MRAKEFITENEHALNEDHVADVEFDTGETKRVRYVPTKKDIVDSVVKYYMRQGRRVVRVNNVQIEWKPNISK
jgi:hypothetical protein